MKLRHIQCFGFVSGFEKHSRELYSKELYSKKLYEKFSLSLAEGIALNKGV